MFIDVRNEGGSDGFLSTARGDGDGVVIGTRFTVFADQKGVNDLRPVIDGW